MLNFKLENVGNDDNATGVVSSFYFNRFFISIR